MWLCLYSKHFPYTVQENDNGEITFECHMCAKIFSKSSNLRQHETIHTGRKPHGCRLGGKAFTHCSDPRKRERTHTGEKAPGCRLCGKAFHLHLSLDDTRELTLERSHMNVIYVIRPSIEVITLGFMGEFTLERNHMNALYVGKPSGIILTLNNMRQRTLYKSYDRFISNNFN